METCKTRPRQLPEESLPIGYPRRVAPIRSLWLNSGVIALTATAFALTGCAPRTFPAQSSAALSRPTTRTTLLFDASHGATSRRHFEAVPDPFANQGLVARGTRGTPNEQKLVFLNDQGFFALPADRSQKAIVFRIAVTGPRGVRIVFCSKDKTLSYHTTLPAEAMWCDVRVPLQAIADGLGPNAMVMDVTIFQKEISDHAALFLQSATMEQ